MKKLTPSLFIMVLGVTFAGSAHAAIETSTLDVSANVVPVCIVSTTPINFGDYDSDTGVYANGDVTVACTSGTIYNIALDAGLYFSGVDRLVADGTGSNTIIYGLFKDSGFANPWGDSDFSNTFPDGASLADTGIGTAQPHTVYGDLSGGFTVPPDIYTDVVTVTVHY
jgi:spore coat protein U-like protein